MGGDFSTLDCFDRETVTFHVPGLEASDCLEFQPTETVARFYRPQPSLPAGAAYLTTTTAETMSGHRARRTPTNGAHPLLDCAPMDLVELDRARTSCCEYLLCR